MADEGSLRKLEDMRAGASERGLALVLLSTPEGLEPMYLGTEPQEDGLTALRMLQGEELCFEFLAYEEDLRRVLDEPVDLSQPS